MTESPDMTLPTGWASWQLANFLAVVSSFETEETAARGAVERVAEALDAEVVAILSGGRLVASVGYPDGRAPLPALCAVANGTSRTLPVPGLGVFPAIAMPLDHPRDTTFVLCRSGEKGLDREEIGLLRGMARVASMTMRMLRLLDDERAARKEVELLADEQAALRRVATLVAQPVPQREIFAAVAEEVGRLAGADLTQVVRYESENVAVRVAEWGRRADRVPDESRSTAHRDDVADMVLHTGLSARIENGPGLPSPTTAGERPAQSSCTVGIPIIVDGRLWGAVITTARLDPMSADTEHRISGFTRLVATAISNAQARAELAASRARAVVAGDETRRRIGRNLHDGAQQQLASVALHLRAMQSLVPPGSDELAAGLSQVTGEVHESIQQLQELARGLHPTILSIGGLPPALKMLANRCAIPVKLNIGFDERLPEAVEIATYYIVSEGLTNAVKHAQASNVYVTVGLHGGALRVEVSDDGIGGADQTSGSGLLGLSDRVAVLGGTMRVISPPGSGTSIIAEIPVGDQAGPRH